MTPDDRRKLNELYEWMQLRKKQAIPNPIDPASRAALKVIQNKGAGTVDLSDTDSFNLTGNAQTINVTKPAAFDGSQVFDFGTGQKAFPYYNL